MAARWVILITDGTLIEFAPELYQSLDLAEREAKRWAWHLSAGGQIEIRERFAGRLEIGIRDVRRVEVEMPDDFPRVEPWIGTYWTRDGYPDPEAIVLAGREEAELWASSPFPGPMEAERVDTTEWHVAATFMIRGEEAYAVASLAKSVREASEG
jgi:hypothetical protein